MSHTAPRPTHNRHAPKTQTTSPKTPQIHAFSPKWSAFWAIPCPAPVDWRGWKAPEGPEGLAAVLVGVGGAWPDRETTRQARPQHTRPHWCGGRRRDRRARAGFETRHRAKRGCLVSRAAGASGAWKTRGATSNMRDHAGPPPTGTSSSLNLQGRVMKPPNPSGGERLHAATYQTARAGKSSRALVSRTWEGPGIRRRTRGRRLPPRPRPTRLFPRSCEARRRWTLPRRPGTRRGCAS